MKKTTLSEAQIFSVLSNFALYPHPHWARVYGEIAKYLFHLIQYFVYGRTSYF